MARNRDLAFDVEEHVLDHYAEQIKFTPDGEQHYPDRITGTVDEPITGGEARAVIIPRPVGFENADRFRRWVTVDPTHWGAMSARPRGWRVFVLMIGLLPDGGPWWSALYEEATLLERRDHSEAMGGFYRFDPGLTAQALILDWDKDRPERTTRGAVPVIDVLSVYLCPECRLLADFAPDDPALAGTCPNCGTDAPLFSFDRVYPPVAEADRASWDAKAEAYADAIMTVSAPTR